MKAVCKSFVILGLGLVALTGCVGGQADDEIHFLRAKPSGAPEMLAPLEGRLVLTAGCLRIQDDGTSYAAIWPFEFSLDVQGDSAQILNGDKAVVAQVGDELRVSGGEVPQLSLEDFEENFIGTTTRCVAPYWRINNDVEVISP